MAKPISEEIKARISELYSNSDQSMGVIAQTLGVSERTVRRYKNYTGLGRPRPDNNRTARPKLGQSSPVASPYGQAIEEQGRPSQNESDQALDITERPSPDNENDNFEEPETINFIGGREFEPAEPELNETEKEEFEWECPVCGKEFNTEDIKETFLSTVYCPHCGEGLNLN